MTAARQPPPRDAAVDGLRALALLPVIMVNWVGYAYLPDAGPLGDAQPADSWWGQAWVIAIATLMLGKGVTLLTFLFGYSQGLSRRARRPEGRAVRLRRMQRLLVLGLVHGLLIYAGDILTLYAICGFWMLRWSDLRLWQLRRRLMVLVTVYVLMSLVLGVWMFDASGGAAQPLRSLATPATWLGWTGLNAGQFALSQLGIVMLGLPLPLGLMTAGLIAARLRLFSHPRWRPALLSAARRWLWPGLLLNLVWGLALWRALTTQDSRSEDLCYVVYNAAAVVMLAGLLPLLVLAAQRGAGPLRALAPAGRHTLSMYLGSSVLSLLLWSGAGLSIAPSTAMLACWSLLYWGLWLVCAPQLRGRLPLEAWLAR